MNYVKHFVDIAGSEISTVGGKGARLSYLYNLGFPVPQGFIVTTSVFKYLLESTDSINIIREKITRIDFDDIEVLQRESQAIQRLITSLSMPQQIQDVVFPSYDDIGGFVAVRSSSTYEDSLNSAFAGQHDSILNVSGDVEVMSAIQKVMSSMFTPQALYYSRWKNIDILNTFMGVIVQKMVEAFKAGVMFTLNPVTGARDEIVIEATFGLGHSVVSGELSPDIYYQDKRTGNTIQQKISDKRWGYYREGVDTIKKPIVLADQKSLSEYEAKQLTEYGRRIENLFGQPQDIEWAIDDGGVKILQVRPVATTGI